MFSPVRMTQIGSSSSSACASRYARVTALDGSTTSAELRRGLSTRRADVRLRDQGDRHALFRDRLLHPRVGRLQDQPVGDRGGPGMVESCVLWIVVRLAAEQPDRGAVVPKVCQQAHEQPAAAHRKHERLAIWEVVKDLGSDGLVSVGPERIQVGMHEIAAAFPGEVGGAAQQVAASASNLDQFHAQGRQLFVLGPGDGLRHDADHAEAERLRARRRAQSCVAHRRHDQLPRPPFPKQVVE